MPEATHMKLGDIAEFQEGYVNPQQSKSEYFDGPVKWLRAVDLNNSFVFTTSRTLTQEGYESAGKSAYLFPPDTLAISKSGTIGRLGILKDWMCGNRAVINIRPRPEVADTRFVFYALLADPAQIDILAEGSVQRNLYVSQLSGFSISLPDLPEQRHIVSLLGALDDKIDLNRRMNETLEAMARAMFKDWFVDFGPTRAKAEGRAPYLAPELWDLFPDALDDEGKPVGWAISEIGKEVQAVGGGTPSTKEPSYWDGGEHHWATPKDLSKLASPVLLDTDRKITDAGVSKISSGLLPIGTVLLSSRAPIGYLAISEVPTAVNQGFIAMVCQKRLPNTFVLFWCHENLGYIKNISGGSTFAEISKRAFRPVPVLVPSEEILAAYDWLIRPPYVRIVANTKENETLTQTRDLLLPKLMSGEIRLREAERQIEDAA